MPDTLTFQEQEHIYRVNGRILRGTTEILERVGLKPKNACLCGHEKLSHRLICLELGCACQHYQSEKEFYLSRGRAVHTACAQWEQGTLDDAALDPRLRGYLTAWQLFCAENAWESTAIEQPLASVEMEFAGTPDRLGLRGTVPMGLDLKCGTPQRWHVWQDAGYSILAVKAGKLSFLHPWMNVYLSNEGTYRPVVYSLAHLHAARHLFAAAALVAQNQENSHDPHP